MKKTLVFLCSLLFLPMVHAGNSYAGNPFDEFVNLVKHAIPSDVYYTRLASLSTVDSVGHPHTRTMHVIQEKKVGFTFNAYPDSNVVKHLKNNAKTSLHFLWRDTHHTYIQVRVNGKTEEVGPSVLRKGDKKMKKGFTQYVLKPNHIQFTLAHKEAHDHVRYEYLNYSLVDGKWHVKLTKGHVTPKVKTK